MATTQTHDALNAQINSLALEVQALKTDEQKPDISIGDYLLARLEQLGVAQMFGVPGDFNLGFLDLVEDHKTINWVGNCNELNAAYAADGYARVKEQSIGVVLTTFGVGELSAMNGIAGAFSEMVPVLHIAGVPSTTQQESKPMLHHTLGDGRFNAYLKASQQFTIAQASLTTVETAAAEIDRVITAAITTARPVYLMLPTDLVFKTISSERLRIPLSPLVHPNDPDAEKFVLDEICKLVEDAEGDVVVLVDACAIRHDSRKELKELVAKTGFPIYSAPMGKTAIDEDNERYGGIYVGSISHPEVREKVESAKLIITVGGLKSDFNSGNFTYSIPTTNTVELHSDHTKIQFARFPDIGMKELLPKLATRLESFSTAARKIQVPRFVNTVPKLDHDIINHEWLWPRVGQFFRKADVIVAETGTSSFGVLDISLPAESIFLAQILWGSIGWTVGSTLGAAYAARERGLGRTILFIGDGSLQLTVQELSTMMRADLKPIIFVLNNSGYTIERYLHGKHRKYNDIVNWNWTKLLSVLGDHDGTKSKSYTVNTQGELSDLLDNEEFASANKIQLVEVMMPMHDAPRALEVQAQLSGKTNAYVAPGSTAV